MALFLSLLVSCTLVGVRLRTASSWLAGPWAGQEPKADLKPEPKFFGLASLKTCSQPGWLSAAAIGIAAGGGAPPGLGYLRQLEVLLVLLPTQGVTECG